MGEPGGSVRRQRSGWALPLVSTLAGLLALGCGADTATDPKNQDDRVAAILVTPGLDTLDAVGETVRLTAIAVTASGDTVTADIAWSTTASATSVDAEGTVTALADGRDSVFATADGVRGVALVTVFLTELTIDGTGRSVSLAGGRIQLTVPGAAFTQRTRVTVTPSTSFPGSPVLIEETVFELGPAGTTFLKPATMEIAYEANEIPPAMSGRLPIIHEAVGGAWTPIGGFADEAARVAEVQLTSAGTIGVKGLEYDQGAGKRLAVGGTFSCVITTDGDTYCWGDGRRGQLGDGGPIGSHTSAVPVAIADQSLRLTQISAGFRHVCGLDETGAAYCWGAGEWGQLGVGSQPLCATGTYCANTPQPVAGNHTFASIDAGGGDFTCGLTAAGAAFCWGANEHGEVGSAATDVCPIQNSSGMPCTMAPVQVPGVPALASLSAGGTHACGITTDHVVYCWGANTLGAFGNGGYLFGPNPPEAGPAWQSPTSFSAGSAHGCATIPGFRVVCAGGNDAGQAGNPQAPTWSIPIGVTSPIRFLTVQAGNGATALGHTCAISTALRAYCWGLNHRGQLGATSGDTCEFARVIRPCSQTPFPVNSSRRYSTIVLGQWHTCAIDDQDQVLCWGFNDYGALGDGTTVDRADPVLVAFSGPSRGS